MKSVVTVANDAFQPASAVVSKKRGHYVSYDQCIQLENPQLKRSIKFSQFE